MEREFVTQTVQSQNLYAISGYMPRLIPNYLAYQKGWWAHWLRYLMCNWIEYSRSV